MEETLVEPTEDGAASRLLKPLAKGTTGLYSGYLLATYCPPKTPAGELHTGMLWLIYGLIAMTSPIGLWLLIRLWRILRGKRGKAADA